MQQLGLMCQYFVVLGFIYPPLYRNECFMYYIMFDNDITVISRFLICTTNTVHLNQLMNFLGLRLHVPYARCSMEFIRKNYWIVTWLFLSVPFDVLFVLQNVISGFASSRYYGQLSGFIYLCLFVLEIVFGAFQFVSAYHFWRDSKGKLFNKIRVVETALSVLHGSILVFAEWVIVFSVYNYFQSNENVAVAKWVEVAQLTGRCFRYGIGFCQTVLSFFCAYQLQTFV